MRPRQHIYQLLFLFADGYSMVPYLGQDDLMYVSWDTHDETNGKPASLTQ